MAETTYPPMDPQAKAEWVKALRSGEYPQTMQYLHRKDGGYCCLGVLIEVQQDDLGFTWESYDGEEAFSAKGLTGRLPWCVNEQYKFSAEAESVLISMNDNGKSFAEIADWIEAHL